MLTLIEAQNYRCLKYVRQSLGTFHVLVGPNGSGKSTFLEIPVFLKSVVVRGPLRTIFDMTPDYRDLFWHRQGDVLNLAIEAAIPKAIHQKLSNGGLKTIRYEVAIGVDRPSEQIALLHENLWLKPEMNREPRQSDLFPVSTDPAESVIHSRRCPKGWRNIIDRKHASGKAYFRSETSNWRPPFQFGPDKSALENLPSDEARWPAATWFKNYLVNEVQTMFLNPPALRRPTPPGWPLSLLHDGANLPWVIENLARANPQAFKDWVAHLRTVLPELHSIRTIERPEDRQRYFVLETKHGLQVPSWFVSDGTLRLLVLTLLAYAPGTQGTYIIEEPENGIHPLGIQAVLDSLSSVYDAQVLLASHSPAVLSLVRPDTILCFAQTEEGTTDIVRGTEHPKLREWKGQPTFDVFFASGILG